MLLARSHSPPISGTWTWWEVLHRRELATNLTLKSLFFSPELSEHSNFIHCLVRRAEAMWKVSESLGIVEQGWYDDRLGDLFGSNRLIFSSLFSSTFACFPFSKWALVQIRKPRLFAIVSSNDCGPFRCYRPPHEIATERFREQQSVE